jgi:hypothetical protein|tara:strand:- start:8077 stop:8541 length:465 start_codon:yes stop_codon:yes gene_type:complete
MKKLGTHFSFFSFLFALLVSSTSFGQIKGVDNAWEQLYSGQGITIHFKKAQCEIPADGIDNEEVYLRFTNTTDKLVYVDWQYDVTYGDKCYNCEGGMAEMSQSIKLAPKQSIAGECGDLNDFRLRIFSKFLNMENPTVMEDFHVKEIVVREINK